MNAVVESRSPLPWLISLILVVLLGVSMAKLFWLVLTPKTSVNYEPQEKVNITNTQKAKINYGKVIANQHLFGTVVIKKETVKKEPVKTVEVAVAPTPLNLELHGLVAYKSKKGFALISMDGGPQKVYGKGDTLKDGVSISDIFPNKVIIDNNGLQQELLLPVNESKRSSSSSNNTLKNNNINQKRSALTTKKSKGSSIRKQAQPRDLPNLSEYRDKVMADPRKLMDIARPSPVIVDGQFIGFRVRPGTQRKFFRQLGFRSNDIITEVNGIVLDDMSKGAMVLGEISQAADLSIKVKRGNEEIYIQHTF